MRQEIADRQLTRPVSVIETKLGEVIDDAIVPAQLALVDERGQKCGGEGLGVRGDGEERLRIDRRRIAERPDAESLGENDTAVFHDGDRGAGHFVCRERLLRVVRERLEVEPLRERDRCDEGSEKDESQGFHSCEVSTRFSSQAARMPAAP